MIVLDELVFVELGTGTPDELGEEFPSRRDFIVAIDRKNMIVDCSFADFELECDLFFGIACDQAVEDLQASAGERRECGFISSSQVCPDLVVDGHMDKRDNALFAWGEVARANAFVQPEGCASAGDIGWADRDDVVVDAALAMDFVVGVRAIPGVFSPDLVAGEDHCLSRELGEVGIFGCAFDGDGLGIFSPAGFGLVGDPSCAVDTEKVWFGVAGHAEVFDLGVDDDLRADKLAEGGEKIVSPCVNARTEIAALACDLVALVDISCGQIGEHWESPSEPWDDSLMVSVPETDSESHDDLWVLLVLWGDKWLSVELWGQFVDMRAGELGIGGFVIEGKDRAVSSTHRVGEHDSERSIDGRCADRGVDQASGCCTDDGEPSRSVLGVVAHGVDIAGFIGISSGLGGDGNISVCVGVELPTCGDLTHVGGTDKECYGLLCSNECGEQDADQNCNDEQSLHTHRYTAIDDHFRVSSYCRAVNNRYMIGFLSEDRREAS